MKVYKPFWNGSAPPPMSPISLLTELGSPLIIFIINIPHPLIWQKETIINRWYHVIL
jgi:hypothetical protein